MLAFGFVSAAPPPGGAPLPDASAAPGAPGDRAAFDAALASTLAVIEQESQPMPAPTPDEERVVPAEWLLSSFFAAPAAAVPATPEPVPGEDGETAAVDPAIASAGVVTAATSDGSEAGMPAVVAPIAVTMPPLPQAVSPDAAASNAGRVLAAAQSGVPGPASGDLDSGAVAAEISADAGTDAGTRVADATAGMRTPAMAAAASPQAAEAAVEKTVRPASNDQTHASPAPKDAASRAAAGLREIPAPRAAVPATGAATTAQAAAAGAPPVVAAATPAPEAPTATAGAQTASAAREAATASSAAPAGVTPPGPERPNTPSMPGEEQAALAAATAPNVPAQSTSSTQPAGAAEIRVGAAIEQGGGGQQAAAGDGGPSQEQGRPSQDFMRFAAALAQVTPSQDGARQAADAAPRSVDMPVPAAAVTPAAPSAAAAAATPASAATAPPPSADAENVGRLVQAMRVSTRAGGWEATVRLNPDHLGDVTIALRVDRNTVSAVVNAEAPGVRQWLESQEQAVRSGMAEHGLQLERFVVQRDGQRKDAQPQQHQQEPRRQPPKRDQAAARFEVMV